MKALLLVTVVGVGLMSSNVQSPPTVQMSSIPLTLKPERVIIPAAIAVGVGVGIVGWAGIKVLNGMLRAWEHKLTNGAPDEVQFTWAEDDYPGE